MGGFSCCAAAAAVAAAVRCCRRCCCCCCCRPLTSTAAAADAATAAAVAAAVQLLLRTTAAWRACEPGGTRTILRACEQKIFWRLPKDVSLAFLRVRGDFSRSEKKWAWPKNFKPGQLELLATFEFPARSLGRGSASPFQRRIALPPH